IDETFERMDLPCRVLDAIVFGKTNYITACSLFAVIMAASMPAVGQSIWFESVEIWTCYGAYTCWPVQQPPPSIGRPGPYDVRGGWGGRVRPYDVQGGGGGGVRPFDVQGGGGGGASAPFAPRGGGGGGADLDSQGGGGASADLNGLPDIPPSPMGSGEGLGGSPLMDGG